jgi:hypothetical protein
MKVRPSVSFPYEKQPSAKPANTANSCVSDADWAAFDTLDDADIVISDECPEMKAADFQNGSLRFNGRAPTSQEIQEGIRILENFLRRQCGQTNS